MPPLDDDRCYAAVQSRDARFDGWFVTAVRTTGIYCRPSCPAITPKRANVEFFPAAATAQHRGYRACKRCRPDATPGSPEWNTRDDVVARAMRLIADGVVDREGVPGLARRLAYSERHLARVLTAELGAGPLAIARAQRAHTARLLIETTDLPLTDVAFAAGFGSVRQFNDTVRAVFAASPTTLRRAASAVDGRAAPTCGATGIRLRLATRFPFDGAAVLAFLGERAIAGVEHWDGTTYRRTLRLHGGHGIVELSAAADHVDAVLRLESWGDLATAVQRVRRLLDLDADPVAVVAHLGTDDALAPLVRAAPGRRAPASVDPFETAVRAIVGQQVSVAGARTVAARLFHHAGEVLSLEAPELDRVAPTPEQIAAAPDEVFTMPAGRRATLRSLAAAVLDGQVTLDAGTDPAEARGRLLAIRGIGVWTADYVCCRGLGHPDTFLPGDLGVVRAMERVGCRPADADRWSPWRSYAVHHLWASLHPSEETTR